MSDTKMRRVMVSPSSADDLLKSTDRMSPDAEEGEAQEETSATKLASEASLKQTATSAAETQNEDLTVPRTIGLIGAISFIVGTIIGSGIFISPKGVAKDSGSVAFTLCSWVICGIISMLAALSYAELGCVIRESGADYAYLDAAFGSIVSFIFSWCYAIFLKPAGMATLALTFAQYTLTPMFEDGCGEAPEIIKKSVAILVLMTLLAINIYSVKLTARIQIIFTCGKLLALIIIIVGGVVKLCQGHTTHLKTGFNNTVTNPGRIAVGFYGGMFSYDAWNAANFISEELINPDRNIPLSIIIGLPLVIIIYLLTNISYFTVMSFKELVDSPAVAVTWAQRVIPTVQWLIPISVAMSAFGSANGTLFSCARLLFVSGRKGHMPEILAMVTVDAYTPALASILLTILSIVFAVSGDIAGLINFVSFLAWIFYGLNMLSVIIFRYKVKYKDLPRAFKIPLVIPVFVFFCAIFIVVVPIVADPQVEFLYAAVFIIIGYMFFLPFVVFKLSLPFMKNVTMFLQLYLRVAKPKQSLD